MKQIILALVLMFGLSACASKVEFSNSRSVVIQYDPVLESSGSVLVKAQASCNLYGRDAVLNSREPAMWGLVSGHYRCIDR